MTRRITTPPAGDVPSPPSELVNAIRADRRHTLLATDFDGVLAPIVDDPEQAQPDPDALAALARLGGLVGRVVIITGRPVRTAVRLGGLDQVAGLERLVVLGQYGVERWDAASGQFHIPETPMSLRQIRRELPELLRQQDYGDARIEDKGRAVAVHTRQLPDPDGAARMLADPIARLAADHGLRMEPGRRVLEIREAGMDKGIALRRMVTETDARTVIYAGDDLGDIPAFTAVAELGRGGLTTCSIWSASTEQPAVGELADVAVAGPAEVASWLSELADGIG